MMLNNFYDNPKLIIEEEVIMVMILILVIAVVSAMTLR